MIESGWCPYCQKVTNRQTELVHKGLENKYETTRTKCRKLIRWRLAGVRKKEE